jgi:hypothetical protein
VAVDNGPLALLFGTKLQYSHSSYKWINHFVWAHPRSSVGRMPLTHMVHRMMG